MNANQPAFPVDPVCSHRCDPFGITKRELFAAMAMQALRSSDKTWHRGAFPSESRLWSSKEIATQAIADADALLAELAKEASHD